MAPSLGVVAYRALTCPLRLLPDFVVIGTVRGGTSAFYHYLTTHPSIGGATTKELNYFDWTYHKGPWWYRAHFPTQVTKHQHEAATGQHFLTGEATPNYLFHPLAPARLAATLPDAKLIVLLRNPVERAFSQYCRKTERQHETRPFAAIVDEEMRVLDAGLDECMSQFGLDFQKHAYLARGLYAEQLTRWLRHFPREQLLILRSEDFYRDPGAILRQALTFLEVPAESLPAVREYERFDQRAPSRVDGAETLDPELRARLSAYFAPHNQRLYALLGRDMGWD